MAGKKKNTEPGGSYVVVADFRDINNFDKVFHIGEDVSHFDEDRITSLISKNLIELEGGEPIVDDTPVETTAKGKGKGKKSKPDEDTEGEDELGADNSNESDPQEEKPE